MSRVHDVMDSPLGPLRLVSDSTETESRVLVGLYFAQHRHAPGAESLGERVGPGRRQPHRDDVLVSTQAQLREYFAGRRREFDLSLGAVGTPFQHQVWQALRAIPFGATRSYGEIAAELGSVGAARAVGLANGRNPISIIVPCHRVIAGSGSLSGYGGGAARKRALLDLERSFAGASLW